MDCEYLVPVIHFSIHLNDLQNCTAKSYKLQKGKEAERYFLDRWTRLIRY